MPDVRQDVHTNDDDETRLLTKISGRRCRVPAGGSLEEGVYDARHYQSPAIRNPPMSITDTDPIVQCYHRNATDRYKSFFQQLNGQSMTRMLEALEYLKKFGFYPSWELLGPYAAGAGVNVPRCKAAFLAVRWRSEKTYEAFEKEFQLLSLVPYKDQRDEIWRFFPTYPLEITCITTAEGFPENYAPYLATLTASGVSFRVNGIADMVAKILKTLKDQSKKIYLRRLNIVAHGDKDGIVIGEDSLAILNMPSQAQNLQRLRNVFRSDSLVFLRGCAIGLNSNFLVRLATHLGAAVAGGHGPENALLKVNYYGSYTICTTDGKCRTSSVRP